MARLYEAEGDIKQAVSFQSRADALIERDNELRLYAGSQSEQLAYFDFLTEQTSQIITLHVRLARDDQRACDLAATAILQRKGRVLDEMAGSLASLQRRLGAGDQALLGQLNDTTSRLAKLVLGGPGQISAAEHQQQVKALEEQRDALESEVSRRSAGFYGGSRTVTLEAVKAAIPEDAAQTPNAVPRSRGWKVTEMMDRVAGSISAAPSPWARRAPIRAPGLWASPAANDETANRVVPARSTRRRPNRSAERPPRSMNPPKVSR